MVELALRTVTATAALAHQDGKGITAKLLHQSQSLNVILLALMVGLVWPWMEALISAVALMDT
jgi:hypothetical protein